MSTQPDKLIDTKLSFQINYASICDRDAHIRVRRSDGERCLPGCVIKRNSGLTLGVMVWGVTLYHGRANLLRIEGGRIIGRLECVRTQLEISEELGIAQSILFWLWKRFQDDGNVSRCYSTGRSRVTTPNEDRYIFGSYCQKKQTKHSIRPVSSATGTTVSRQIVYRRLRHIGLYARRPVRCVPLTATHCHLRLTWIIEHALWTPQQWSCVMFSDESRFSLQSDSHRTLLWRAPGTRYHQENTIERHRYGGAG
ncbi:HTH_Tnp_Tc3_2 domain-containing protein [Trichonephila clavipes]|nr:HTH_Tnp_Tc3_2 domain-containing protein [Trichonephila clavipes]